jgi:sortase A
LSSGAFVAPLLFVTLAACTAQPQSDTAESTGAENGNSASSMAEQPALRERKPETTMGGQAEDNDAKTVKAVLPEDVLSKEDLEKPPPKYEDWYEEGSDTGGEETSGATAGTIPAVRLYNFGRDPGDRTTRPST